MEYGTSSPSATRPARETESISLEFDLRVTAREGIVDGLHDPVLCSPWSGRLLVLDLKLEPGAAFTLSSRAAEALNWDGSIMNSRFLNIERHLERQASGRPCRRRLTCSRACAPAATVSRSNARARRQRTGRIQARSQQIFAGEQVRLEEADERGLVDVQRRRVTVKAVVKARMQRRPDERSNKLASPACHLRDCPWPYAGRRPSRFVAAPQGSWAATSGQGDLPAAAPALPAPAHGPVPVCAAVCRQAARAAEQRQLIRLGRRFSTIHAP